MMSGEAVISHRRSTPFRLVWLYGPDLTGVEITATVSSPSGQIDRLRVLARPVPGERDLMAEGTRTALWPPGRLAIDISLRRGSTAGRLDTFFIRVTE